MATSRKARGAKKSGIAVDFTGVETQVSLPEQDFLLEVEEVEQKTSDNSGADYLSFTFKIVDGKFAGKKLWHNCSLQPQALFNLRGVLEALGMEIPAGPMELDPADLIGLQCGGAVQNETYEGKNKSRVVEFFPAEDLDGAEDGEDPVDEETKPATKVPAKGKKSTPAPEPEDKPEDDEGDGADLTWEDVQEAEKEDLIELATENEIKLTLKVKKDLQLLRDTICTALELEAPEAEPEVKAPAKKTRSKAKSLAVGSKVNFTDDEGEVLEGTITEIDGADATVDVDGEEWELELSDLTAA